MGLTNTAASAFTLGLETWLLGAESANVIALRTAKLAKGDIAAGVEAQLMVGEKIAAMWTLGMAMATGQLGSHPQAIAAQTVRRYRKDVRANAKRLSRRR